MKKSFGIILLVTILLSVSTTSMASRILTAPTADLLGVGLGELDFNYQRERGSLEVNLGLHPQANLGVRQYFGGSLVGTAKIGILTEGKDRPGVALGGEIGLGEQNFYVALSKQLGAPGLRGHLAWGSGRYSRGMGGIGLVLNPVQVKTTQGWVLPTTSLVFEYDGRGLNGGLVAQFNPEFQGYLSTSFGQGVGFGLNYKVEF
jgi:hypothetical protein